MSPADITVTSGSSVVFASALADSDEVDIIAFGTFSLASINASNLDSGTVPSARVSGSYTGITGTGALNAGSITSGFGSIDTGSSTITTTGAITGGSLVADNITIDGTEIDLSSGDLTIDVEGKIALDANDDGSIKLQDNGTEYARIDGNSSNLRIISQISDKDIIFNGNDGGSAVTALTLDMSDGGRAAFGHNADFVDGRGTRFGAGQDLQIYHDGSDSFINDTGTGSLIIRSNRHRIQSDGGENVIEAHADGAVELYYDTSKKLETTTTGINITGAVNIGGTGSANELDDYEEGTWTLAQGGQGTWSSPTIVGKYTKIGQMVRVQIEQTGGTISYQKTHFSGLPFAVNGHGYKGIGGATNGTLDNLGNIVAYSGTTLIYPLVGGSTQTNLIFSITYFTDS
jgi:hypothetical protein